MISFSRPSGRIALRAVVVAGAVSALVLSTAAHAVAAPRHGAGRVTSHAASGGCTITTVMPSKLSVATYAPNITMRLAFSGCEDASYYYVGPSVSVLDPLSGDAGFFWWENQEPTTTLTDTVSADHAGVYRTAKGDFSLYDINDNQIPVTWRYSTMIAKFRAATTLTITRTSGTSVRASGTAVRYNSSSFGYVAHSGALAYLQRYTPKGWVSVRTARVASNGSVTTYYAASARAVYRWSVPETSAAWSAVSTTRSA